MSLVSIEDRTVTVLVRPDDSDVEMLTAKNYLLLCQKVVLRPILCE